MTVFNLGAGLFLVALALSGFWPRKAPGSLAVREDAVPWTQTRLYWFFVALFGLTAIAVRVYAFASVPGGVNQDEAMAAVDAYALALHGTDRFGTWLPAHFEAWGYAQMSVLMSYLSVPFLWLFGLKLWAFRLPVLLISLGGVWVLHRFAASVFGRRVGLIVLGLAAVCPWHIMQSRWALDCNLMAHFTLFGVYGLYLGIQKKRWAYVGIVCMGLCMYSYGIAVYTLPVLLAGLAAYLLWKKQYRVRDVLLCAVVFFAISWPIIVTMMINAFGWETISLPFVTMANFPDSIRSGDILFFTKHQSIGAQFTDNVKALGTILLQDKDLPWNAIEGFGTVYGFGVSLMALAILIPAAEQIVRPIQPRADGEPEDTKTDAPDDRALGGAILGVWLAVSVFSGIVVNGANINRVNHIFYPLILLSALGIEHLVRRGPRGAGLSVAAVCGLAFCLFLTSYFGGHAKLLEWYNYDGFGECVQWAEQTGAQRVAVTQRNLYGNSKQTMEILTLFYTQTDAKCYQGQTEEPGWLPYAERYTYTNFDNAPPALAPDTVYIFHREQQPLFPETEYRLTFHGYYATAIPIF